APEAISRSRVRDCFASLAMTMPRFTRNDHPEDFFMTARLKDKIAVITAAGQGIGRAIAESFIAEGAIVIASDLDDSKLKGLSAKQSVKLDVRSTPAVEALAQSVIRELGAPHILVNCAG